MNESPASKCCVCHSLPSLFHPNILSLRTKHTNKYVHEVLESILSDDSTSNWSTSDSICIGCVDKINDYDDTFEKLQSMRRELNDIHHGGRFELTAALSGIEKNDFELVPIAAVTIEEFNANAPDGDPCSVNFEIDNTLNDSISEDGRQEQKEETSKTVVECDAINGPVSVGLNSDEKTEFYCEECGKNFQCYRGLTIHITKMHKDAVGFECSLCHSILPNKLLLQKHSANGGCRKTEFYCEECGKNINSYNGLMIHMSKLHKGNAGFECTVCHKFFPNKHLLEKHTTDASCRQMDFKCQICQRSFMLPKTLKRHMKTHKLTADMVGPFECDYCGIACDDFDVLKEHKALHLDRPDFQCLECDRILKRKCAFKLHVLIHSKQRQSLCDICGKEFSHPASLQSHLKYHYDDLKMECYICKTKHETAWKLRRHMHKHTGEKPYQCSECGKYFAQPQGRNRHFRLHFEPVIKPHKCTMCDAAFIRAIKLSEHYLKAHDRHVNIAVASNRVIKVSRERRN